MGIGPFSTYSPPGVSTQTTAEEVAAQLIGGVRIPTIIGTGKETLSQSGIELIRGSSSVADTPIFGEDISGRWVVGGTATNPQLGGQDGSRIQFRVRNYPIVDGGGTGRTTYDPSRVSVSVNGSQAVVAAVDGLNGLVTLLIPPGEEDVVNVNYYFHRKDTRVTDDVSAQITQGQAVLVAPKFEPYAISTGSNQLIVTVNDVTVSTVNLTVGTSRTATDVANDVNAAAIPGLVASVHIDNQGLNHVQFVAAGNILIGSGSVNGSLGLNAGDYTNRSKQFRVFNGPMVDGSDGGITTTDPSKVVVLVNGAQVLAKAVDGLNRLVTLPFAPNAGSTVTVQYYFNSFQDTFDYLPNRNIVNVGNVGIAPGRRDYLNGPDFVVINDNDQSKIQWGTSFQVQPGMKTGTAAFDSTKIVGLLVDNKVYGVPTVRFTDPTTSTVSTTKFVLPLSPRIGNGRDTPLGSSMYQTVTNGRIDLPSNRPDLVTCYVGKSLRDAMSRPSVVVLEVDSSTNIVTLRDPVSADNLVFATFWYNRISDDTLTFTVLNGGASGVGQYTIGSQLTGSNLFGVVFGTKTSLAQTIQWPSGVETLPDAIHTGAGTPVPETVTVTFSNTLQPATHASFSNPKAEPYDIFDYTRVFGGTIIDGLAAVNVDLSTAFKAVLVGSAIETSLTFISTDRLVINVDGITLAAVDVSAATTPALVATAINAVVDADTQVHTDGTGTFASTAPNNLASVSTYGTQQILTVKGRSTPSSTNGLLSNVTILSPTVGGQTDASTKVGFAPNYSAAGSYNAINQAAKLVGSKTAPFSITAGINDSFQLNVDGVDISAVLPSGTAVTLDQVVTTLNDAYITSASAADIATYTADLITLTNSIRTAYNTHRVSTTYHVVADAVNTVTLGAAVTLGDAITLLNDIKAKYGAHRTQATIHELNDTVNLITAANCTNLQTAVVLAHQLKNEFNGHLAQQGVHGHDDVTNTVATVNATDLTTSINLVNAIKAAYNTHRTFAGVHVTNDATNSVVSLDAIDQPTAITLANEIKAKMNLHLTQSGVHVVNDTTNAVVTADASDLTTLQALANAEKAAFNAHLLQLQGIYHVHGTNDLVNAVATSMAELIAHTGLGAQAGELVLTSRLNTVVSGLLVKTTGTANDILGFASGASAQRHQPTATDIANALNANTSWFANAVSYKVQVAGLGGFLRIDSRTTGTTSTISFSGTTNTAFITDTGLGIVAGVSGDVGENAQAGFTVASSAGLLGSHGTGFPGQTYTDVTTGLQFTVLPATAGDYANNGSFTLVANQSFVADASIPVRAVGGVEVTVFNTLNMNPGTTAIVTTYPRTGTEPKIGDVYYVSYDFAKTDLAPALFQSVKKIRQNFGNPTPDNPLSLAAQLALLNGAVIVGLKQVLRAAGSSQAPSSAYTAAIDELRKPITGNIKPDVITPLTTDPAVFSYANQHAIFMGSPRQQGERVVVVGTAVGTSPLGVQSIARGLSSEVALVCYPDSYVLTVTDDQGNQSDQLVDGSFCAAAIAGSLCSSSVDAATPLTRRSIFGFKRVGRVLEPTDANQIAVSGVTVIEQMDSSLRVRHGLTTLMDTVITRTPSVTLTIHYVQQVVRRTLDPFIGQKFTGSLQKSAENALTGAFSNLIDQQIVQKVMGIFVGVDENDPTILRAEVLYVPVFPLEYILASMSIRIRS